jgi:hypothetical protein
MILAGFALEGRRRKGVSVRRMQAEGFLAYLNAQPISVLLVSDHRLNLFNLLSFFLHDPI